jgi:ferredoxin
MALSPDEMPTDEESLQQWVGSRLALHTEQVREDIREPGRKGFFTDTTVCIGCKACEVACKQWNQLPDDGFEFTGTSYDNTGDLGASTWRHVAFIERPGKHPTTGFADISWFEDDRRRHRSPSGPTPTAARTSPG